MSRKPTLEPGWLVGLLHQWALRGFYQSAIGLGFPAASSFLRVGSQRATDGYDPTGYGAPDFRDLDAALNALSVVRRLAVVRCFAPWTACVIDKEFVCSTERWLHELKEALKELTVDLDRRDLEAYSA